MAEADKVFGGPMPAACLYAPQSFIDKHPQTTQALANAMVRANKWIQAAGPSDIITNVPESYLLGDRAVYIDAFLAAKGALSPDGLIPEKGADTALRALASIDPEIGKAKIDLAAVWTNDVKKAHEVAKKLQAGTVWVNTYNAYDPAAPFGGYKHSGFGRELSAHALDHYTQVKSVWVDLGR